MIIEPLNDHACLGPITEIARRLVAERDPELTALTRELSTPAAVIEWIRGSRSPTPTDAADRRRCALPTTNPTTTSSPQ